MNLKKMIVVLAILSLSPAAWSQSFGGSNLAFRGMAGYLGFGVADITVVNPAANFELNQGTYVYLGGEKQIGLTGLFITIGINFMEAGGSSFYDYTTLGGQNYTQSGTELNFDSSHLQLSLGLKFKIFPTGWFRPYGEGGGLFGYHTINYSGNNDNYLLNGGASDGGQNTEDGLIGFGYYAEAGIEIDFSELWGIRTGVRYQITETRPFETLGEQKVKYEVRAFQFAIGRRF
jgi:hypothetical protein